jgi:hypothetical protein
MYSKSLKMNVRFGSKPTSGRWLSGAVAASPMCAPQAMMSFAFSRDKRHASSTVRFWRAAE